MKLKKIIRISVVSFLSAFVLLMLGLVVKNTISLKSNQLSSFFGYTISYVPTESMKPVIEPGDTVLIKKTSFDDIKIGDIIVYYDGERFIIHRVVGQNPDGSYITQGDNIYTNPEVDEVNVTRDNFHGTYLKTANMLNISSLVKNKNYIFPLCILVFLIILVGEGFSLASHINESQKKKLEALSKEMEEEKIKKLKEEALKELLEEFNQKPKQ